MAPTQFRPETLLRKYRIKHRLTRNLLSECFGTFLLLFIGTSIIAQLILSREKLNTWIQINIGWGLAITFSVYAVHKLSGGHLNPAISLVMWTFGHLKFFEFILYSIVQVIGAFIGAWATYLEINIFSLFSYAINEFDGGTRTAFGPNGTANIFATYPAEYLTVFGAYIDQIVGTGFLAFFVAAITDKRNKIPGWTHPMFFGFLVLLIGTCFGMNIGYPLNPARDFGPRIFTYFIYGSQVFTHPYSTWFLVPIIAPMVGAVSFAWAYHLFLGMHIPNEEYDVVHQNELEDREAIMIKK
ncbi:unnamed protein product [Thelazia callipaeda]|uniref:Aquaporin n=1 Tax=Thelazia callipaeda TaxID=103827 RepID=A0A0N5D4A8_THECL|nr:unnamed protein product [Thelazia callipaeda]